ncbi:unnamed protein product [Caenorhabditis auriculariae]|uniref:Uncharacterized protein n=1 Tax=Caenorhabditis auriculariae TaxID=2777116 RepID=A0A8S1GVY4_9PELO|nr:unnamed protein product [Caenorhabditis auriculariae]
MSYYNRRRSRSYSSDSSSSSSSSGSRSNRLPIRAVAVAPTYAVQATPLGPFAQPVPVNNFSAVGGGVQAFPPQIPPQQYQGSNYGINQQPGYGRPPIGSGVQANVQPPYPTSQNFNQQYPPQGYNINQQAGYGVGQPPVGSGVGAGFQQPYQNSGNPYGNNPQMPYGQGNQYPYNPNFPR